MKLRLLSVFMLIASSAFASGNNTNLVCNGDKGPVLGNFTQKNQYSITRNGDGNALIVNRGTYLIIEDGPVYIQAVLDVSKNGAVQLNRLIFDRLSGEIWIGTYWENINKYDGFDDTYSYNGIDYFLYEKFTGTCKKVEPLL